MSALVVLLGWALIRAMALEPKNIPDPPQALEPASDALLSRWMFAAIGMGVFLVIYGVFYCRSVPGFVSPHHWIQQAWTLVGWPRWVVTGLVAIIAGRAMARCFCLRQVIGWSLTLVLGWRLLESIREHQAGFLQSWLGWLTTDWHLVLIAGLLMGWMVSGRKSWRFWLKVLSVIVIGWLLAQGAYLVWHHLWLKTVGHPSLTWKNIWWHRYMGVLLPLVILLLALLISHLPTKLLRWSVIFLFVGLNIINGMNRVMIDSEPRWDLVAADLYQDIQTDDLRVFGFQGLSGQPWRDPNWAATANYYLCLAHRCQPSPSEFRSGRIRQRLGYFQNLRRDRLANELKKTPQVQRAIVWQYVPPLAFRNGTPSQTWEADLAQQGWHIRSRQTYSMWDHWNWKYEGYFERLELTISDKP